jgi:hypothetical protein
MGNHVIAPVIGDDRCDDSAGVSIDVHVIAPVIGDDMRDDMATTRPAASDDTCDGCDGNEIC